MKYIKISPIGDSISSCWAIEQFTIIPSRCGEDVIRICTLSGTLITLYGGKNCTRFLSEFEDPSKVILDFSQKKVEKTKEEFQKLLEMKGLSFCDVDGNLVFEY